ncbi:fatty acid desaturase [Rhodovibrionaceae bacterium A322]
MQKTTGSRHKAQQTQTALPPCPKKVEWPTVMLALAIYSAFGLLTWFHADLPFWLLLLLGAYVVAWQTGLQHEVAHGHPTPWPLVNRLIVLPNLWLWLPFESYRSSHLQHHRDEDLTLPGVDPESYYVSAQKWDSLSKIEKQFYWLRNTCLGRFTLGTAQMILTCWLHIARKIVKGTADWQVLGLHLVSVALVYGWVVEVCGMSFGSYLLLMVLPGSALALVRSFLEHQADPAVGQRTVIIEAGPVFSLLFLNNNLHIVHHDKPGMPWYQLASEYKQHKAHYLQLNGGYRFSGYLEVFCRYFFWPKENPVHPGPHGRATLAMAPATRPELSDNLPHGFHTQEAGD